MATQIHASGDLRLEITEDEHLIRVVWSGRSTARDPSAFLAPILTRALRDAMANARPLQLDFRKLEYMNSSSITPVIRILHEARRNTGRVTILFMAATRWQELSFSALAIFQTPDLHIEIRGV